LNCSTEKKEKGENRKRKKKVHGIHRPCVKGGIAYTCQAQGGRRKNLKKIKR
jgi:hypothetical protein